MMIHQAKAVWYTPQLLGVLSLVVLLALSTPVRAQVTVEAERYNTAQLISRTLTALPDCLSYCLLGIELRMRVTLTGVRLYFVPRVKHHMAALHVITANETTQEPYIEWALIMGRVQKLMLDQLAVLLGAEESGGRLTRYGQYGRHQATRFKENALMGHPVAILPRLLDSSGGISGSVPSQIGAFDPPSAREYNTVVAGFANRWSAWAVQCFDRPLSCSVTQPLFPTAFLRRFFDIADAVQSIIAGIEALQTVLNFVDMAQTLREIAAVVGGEFGVGASVRIDRLLCPNDIDLFYPYYLSGPDALFWRSGWPITDADKITTLFNPFSSDRVGQGWEIWGHIYPRAGFVNHDHDAKAAVVVSERGVNLIGDNSIILRPKRTVALANPHWQSVSPQPTRYCTANSTDLPVIIDQAGGYGYNLWPEYRCSLSDVGVRIGFISYSHCF